MNKYKSAERNKKLFAQEREKIEDYIKSNTGTNFITSENGFWYSLDTISTNTESKLATFGDVINYNHSISDLNGNIIYSSEELKTKNYRMDKEELFTGLRQGLKLMKAGETYTFIFPLW